MAMATTTDDSSATPAANTVEPASVTVGTSDTPDAATLLAALPAAESAATSAGEPYNKQELLAELRRIEDQLYGAAVEAQVRQQPPGAIQDFVAARLHLTAVIARLNAALMRDIRTELEARSDALRAGTSRLETSLSRLAGAAGWAKAVNGLIGLLGQVVPLL